MTIDAKSRAILTEALKQKTPVFFGGTGLDISFQTFLLEVRDDRLILENRVKPEYISRVVASKSFSLLVRMVRFQADRIASDGKHIIFPLKEDSVIAETRQAERFAFTADERVVCEFLNPFDGETRLTKSVMDMSATGLSVRTSFESKLFEPGAWLPDLRVLIDGEPYIQGAGSVVYNRKLLDLKGQLRVQVGIKFENGAG